MMDSEFEILKRILIKHEGMILKPYRDTEGKLTIGIGRNLDDVGISEHEAKVLFYTDISRADDGASQFDWYPTLNSARQIVVLSMIFNMGIGRFKSFKKMIQALEQKNYKEAAVQMLDSKWHAQVGKRAEELAFMMETGEMIKV